MELAAAWIKVIHIIALALWAAGLLYLPALFAAHPVTGQGEAFFRLRAATRFIYVGVTSPAAVITIVSGSALIVVAGAHGGWLALKVTAVALMVGYHTLCGFLLSHLRTEAAAYHPWRLLSLTAVPSALVPVVLWLVLAKPL